jgi:uncharacterized membrane protein YhaH (DUF805 family)
MQIKVKCKCNKVFATSSENAGKRAKCSNCGAVLVIPNTAPPSHGSVAQVNTLDQASASASDDANLGAIGHQPWSDDDLLGPQAPVAEEERNPYRAPTTLPSPVERSPSDTSFFKSLFTFNGRISRSTFWAFEGAFLFIIFILGILIRTGPVPTLIAVVIFWIMLGPGIAFQVKRWHDLDKPGWFMLINFIPFVGGLISLVVLGAIPGTRGANSYGPDPLRKAR